jgi:hypothetical protein
LPTVQPGQLWLVELPATAPHFSPLEHQALTSANVVIYDRALAPTVARLLPLGGYAEPAVPGERASAWERCLGFARDGWSVVRLVDPRVEPGGLPGRERTHRICRLSERWLGVERLAGFPVLIFANTGCGAYERSEAALDGLINHQSFEQTRTLTLIFRAIDTAAAPRFRVASANGLAG